MDAARCDEGKLKYTDECGGAASVAGRRHRSWDDAGPAKHVGRLAPGAALDLKVSAPSLGRVRGAFGAMAFTVGRYGIVALGPLAKLIATFYVTSILFVLLVLGAIARVAGFGIVRFLLYIKEEILLVLAVRLADLGSPVFRWRELLMRL